MGKVHKLRDVMGRRDSLYVLHGDMEVDEGFFSTDTPEEQKNCPLKRGHGSQCKTSVLVMAESSLSGTMPAKKHSTPKIVEHLKMQVIGDFKASTITDKIKAGTDGNADVTTYGLSSYASLEKKGAATSHHAVVADNKKSVEKVLPRVHIAISNAKRNIPDTYHDIKAEFLQLYLNEFCYKFNRRYFGLRLFDRLELCACMYRAEFKHRIY